MKFFFILLILFPCFCFSQIPVGYYNTAKGLTGNPLKVALYNIIKNHTQISYAGLWTAYQKTDKKINGKVWDIYSDIPSGAPPYQFTFIISQCGNYVTEGDCYNREHSWPQSWFNSLAGPVSDLFHVYPTDGKVNGERSNYPYGNVGSASITTLNGGKLDLCNNLGYNLTVFEPIDEYKGDLARSYFYMTTRYYSEDAGWATSDATNKATILPWELNVLLQWHHLDPVSAKEIARNDSIYYKIQHNRNPFIDHPQWADSIWVNTVSTFVKENQFLNTFSLAPNPTFDSFRISTTSKSQENYVIQITDISGKVIDKMTALFSESITIDCSKWNSGLYFVSVNNSKYHSNFKFIKMAILKI